jgi:hypothetical protein
MRRTGGKTKMMERKILWSDLERAWHEAPELRMKTSIQALWHTGNSEPQQAPSAFSLIQLTNNPPRR